MGIPRGLNSFIIIKKKRNIAFSIVGKIFQKINEPLGDAAFKASM